MRRIVTIDVLRGFAIIMMTLVHTWLNVADLSPYYNLDIASTPPGILIIGAIFFILGHSRTLFLFLSAVIHQYKFMKSLKEGKNPERVLYNGIVKGGIVYLLGILRESLLNPWGAINSFILNGTVNKTRFRLAYLFETLQVIGLSIIFLSIISYIFFKKQWHKDTFFVIVVLSTLAFLFLFLAPTVHESVTNFLGYDITAMSAYTRDFQNTAEYFTRFFWMSIAGVENPIFPNFFVTCIGGIFGYLLAKPNPGKKFIRFSAIAGTFLFVFGILYWIVVDKMFFDIKFRIHPTWYMLMNMGLQIYYLTALLAIFEFRKKANLKRYARWTRLIRRWGVVALTIYMMQFADLFIRMLCTNLIGIEFTVRHQQGLGWAVYMMFVSFLFFEIIIRLWEKLRFIGTFEWFLILLIKLFAGRKKYNSARIKVKESLYEVEPISFVNAEVTSEKIKPKNITM